MPVTLSFFLFSFFTSIGTSSFPQRIKQCYIE